MKDKQPMKMNLLTAILLIIILVLCGAFLLYNSNEKISELEDELANLKSAYFEEPDEDKEASPENTSTIIPSIFTATEKNKTQGMVYSFNEYDEHISLYIKDGIPYVRTLESFKNLVPEFVGVDENQIKIKSKEYTPITGFSKKVINVHIGTIGHDVLGMTIIFLMEDGTVEYSTISNLATNTNSQGKIEGLNNIVGLYNGSLNDDLGEEGTGAGYATIVALDSENYFYNLNDYL